MYKNKIIPFLF